MDKDFTETMFQHILEISNGRCQITDDTIVNTQDEDERKLLFGLMFLHEELQLNSGLLEAKRELEIKQQDLEQKNAELKQFTYVASHDLQEPLRTIKSFTQLLDQQYRGQLDEKADKYLFFISQAATRMSDLVKGLLDYGQIQRDAEKTAVDCNSILNAVIEDLAITIAETKTRIKVGKLPTVKGYETELRLLFQNLISNAIKFNKPGAIPEIAISAKQEDGYWKFACKDNGIGIASEHMNKIFLIFQRLHNKKDYEGSGIGLAHCQKIVSLHNGNIWVESQLDEGSTFFVTIPY